MKKFIRTDLACESQSKAVGKYKITAKEINGIDTVFSTLEKTGETECVTLYTGKCWMYGDSHSHSASSAISECIKHMLARRLKSNTKILIIGLGNRQISSDSLGPSVIDLLYPTAHIDKFRRKIGTVAPGVEGECGFSAYDITLSCLKLLSADICVVIDSLCAASTERLTTTVQLSMRGIMPGSGVGNHKKEISESTLGIPVLSIGVPTVCDLGAVADGDGLSGYYVSPNDIDLSVKSMAQIISKGIELALYE